MIAPPMLVYRIGSFFYRRKLVSVSRFFSYVNRLLFSVWLPSSAKIGKKTRFGYWGLGVVIHSDAIIGERCLIAQNVTVGRNFGDTSVPRIGNNVYVGAGSVIFGEITVGDNVIIGANSVINKSVPSNAVVLGNPGRIVRYTELPYFDLD